MSKEDPQQLKVYDWEDKFVHSRIEAMSIGSARWWVRWACKQYKVKPPIVSARPDYKHDFSFYRTLDHRVALLKRHRNIWASFHEAAHAIAWTLLGDFTHGPKWLGIYMWLLSTAGIAPLSALKASAKEAGLRWSHMGNIAPNKIRKRLRTLK